MSFAEFMQQYGALLAPLILLQLALIVIGLRDLSQRAKVRGPKWLWAIIIVCGELLGPAAYFLVGREE
jgi:hypothetical protein